nr:beta-thymosin [Dugesia japonica]
MGQLKMSDEVKIDVNEIGAFNKETLKHIEVLEKDSLPDAETLALEKKEHSLREEIEKGTNLKHVEVEEKVALPTKEDIEAEKQHA